MRSWITRNVTLPSIYWLRGEPALELQPAIRAFHMLDRDAMDRLQWQKLVALIEFLETHNRYYGEQFRALHLKSEDLRSPHDYLRYPLLDKDTLRRHQEIMRSDCRLRASLRRTSGSTGIPLQFLKDREASAYMDAMMHELYGWYGVRPGDRQARVWGLATEWRGRLLARFKDFVLNRSRLVYYDLSPENSSRFFKKAIRKRPTFLYGMVNPMVEFAQALVVAGHDPAQLELKVVIATSEMLLPAKREVLRRLFGCPVANEYGCSETGIIAMECPHGSLHLANHNIYLELLNPETLEAVAPGELGEVVITELHSRLMPFVRYRVGDLARISSQSCPCGLASPTIESLEGRVTALIQTPGGRRLSSYLVSYCMPQVVDRYLTIQRSVNFLEILITAQEPVSSDVKDDMVSRIQKAIGEHIQIEVKQVAEIPREKSGKLRAFISELGHDGASLR